MTGIDIVNAALGLCGLKPITALGSATPAGKVATPTAYAAARDWVIENREWTFAKQRISLAQDAVVPAFGYTFQYVIPSPVIRLVRTYVADGVNRADGVREGQRFLTNEAAPIYAEVLVRVDESLFSPGAVQTLIAYLVSIWAIPLTENRQLAADYEKVYEARISEAGAMDGSQGTTQILRPLPLPGRRRTL